MRVNAATLLFVLASSGDAGEEEESAQCSLDSGVMTREDQRRLLAFCVNKARAGVGKRVRERQRRSSEKRERAGFRRLAEQLADWMDAAGTSTATSRTLETHIAFKTHSWYAYHYFAVERFDPSSERPAHMAQLRGWRWPHIVGFLQRYFGSRFWPMLKVCAPLPS